MVQIIKAPERKPSFGEIIGAGLGKGFSSGADLGTQMYLKDIQSKKDFEEQEKLLRLKGELENQKPQKPLNALQEAQRDKYLAQIDAMKEQSDLFNSLLGNGENRPTNKPQQQNLFGITKPEEMDQTTNEETKKPFSLSDLPENKLKALAAFEGQPGKIGIIGNMAANEMKKKEKNQEQNLTTFHKDREYHSKFSMPIIEAANERLKTSDVNKGIREQLKRDIASGETSGFWPYMVDKLGLESFRNPESARFSNEVKNIFVGSLNEIPGARPNQFLEKLLSSAQPQLGRSVEANLSVMDIADFVEDLKDEQARLELEIGKEDRKEHKYIKEDVSERARERMGDYANRKQEEMALKIQKRHEDTLENSDLINELLSGRISEGNYVTPRVMRILWLKNDKDKEKAIKEAVSLGLKFPEYME